MYYIIEIRTYTELNGRRFESRYLNTDERWPRAFLSIEQATRFTNLSDLASACHDYARGRERATAQDYALRPRADRVLVHEMRED